MGKPRQRSAFYPVRRVVAVREKGMTVSRYNARTDESVDVLVDVDVLECGHELAQPQKKGAERAKKRHCTRCPSSPVSAAETYDQRKRAEAERARRARASA